MRLGDAAPEAAALTFGQSAPDPEPLVVGQRVLEAFGLDRAGLADALGRAGRAPLLREEAVGVLIQARRPLIPGLDLDGDGAHPCLLNRCSEASGSHAYGCLERHDRNYIGGILRRLECQFQAESIFLWTGRPVRAQLRVSGRWPMHGIASPTDEVHRGVECSVSGES